MGRLLPHSLVQACALLLTGLLHCAEQCCFCLSSYS